MGHDGSDATRRHFHNGFSLAGTIRQSDLQRNTRELHRHISRRGQPVRPFRPDAMEGRDLFERADRTKCVSDLAHLLPAEPPEQRHRSFNGGYQEFVLEARGRRRRELGTELYRLVEQFYRHYDLPVDTRGESEKGFDLGEQNTEIAEPGTPGAAPAAPFSSADLHFSARTFVVSCE